MKKHLKFVIGILISVVFIVLAFNQVKITDVIAAIGKASPKYILLLLFFVIFSAYVRAVRWYYFLLPIKKVDIGSLFSALLIGYGANVILPAHLGEIIRAYILGRKKDIPVSSTLATILVERIIDILTFLFLLIFLLLLYDFPSWVKDGAAILFVLTIMLIIFIIFLRLKTSLAQQLINFFLRPAPAGFKEKINKLIFTFVKGFTGLKKKSHYFIIFVLSIVIWAGYVFGFAAGLKAFNLHLPWIAPIVLMVITTISIVVPSSPGYVGTYHYLCQLGLGFFGVPKSEALAFAIVLHAFNTIPFLISGLYCAWREGFNLFQFSKSQPDIDAEDSLN